MKFYQVVEFDRLNNISKFNQIPFGGGLSLWIKNPGMTPVHGYFPKGIKSHRMTPLLRFIRAADIP